MTTYSLTVIISSSLTLIVFIIVAFELWPSQRVDIFRQQMFELRDELFDFAMREEISFSDPAYALLRQLMNGFIRYAHNLTPFRVFFSFVRWSLVSQAPVEEWNISWKAALEKIEGQDRKEKLEEFHSKTTSLVAGQLLLSPGLILTFIVPLIIAALLATQIVNLKKLYRDAVHTIPTDFLQEEAVASITSPT